MLFANGAGHRQRRVPMSRAFAFKLIEELRPYIRTTALRILSESHAPRRIGLPQ